MHRILTLIVGILWSISALTIHAQQISVSGTLPLRPGTSVTLTAPAGGFTTYSWTRNNADVVGNQSTLTVQTPGYYRVSVSSGGNPTVYGPIRVTASNGLGNADKNYVQEDVALVLGVKTEASLDNAQTKKTTTLTYGDGLVRPLQQVSYKASPTSKDLVQFFDFDAAGHQPRMYLPFTKTADGSFTADPLTAQQNFYNGTVSVARETAGLGFAESIYEDTPNGGVIEQGSAGSSWQVTKDGSGQSTFQGHTRRTIARAIGNGEVALWTYTPAADGTIGTASQTLAPAQSLTVTQQIDEDGKGSWRYTNARGQVVAAETYAGAGAWLTTAYAFDLAGRMVMVMSPEGVKRAVNDGEQVNSAFLARWAHLTKYDERGREVAKKAPGRGWEFTVYDRWDRVVATQDANHALQSWAFTKYDELNRPVITGRINSTQTREQLAADIEAAITAGTIGRYEIRAENTSGAVRIGYTLNKTWPAGAAVSDLYTVSYYDDYSFLNTSQSRLQYQAESSANLVAPSSQTGNSTLTVGYPTVNQTRTLGSSDWLTAVTYYDAKGRIIQTKSENQLGGIERRSIEFNDAGKVLSTYTAHNVTGTGPAHTIRYRYTYYDNDQVKETFGWFNKQAGTDEQLLAKKEYNELGQLVDDKLGIEPATGKYLQSIDYRYNIRGWLTYINNRELVDGVAMDAVTSANTDPDAKPDLFGLELKYDSNLLTGSAVARYNGNIAESAWRSRRDNKGRAFGYEYDDAGRIKNARYAAYLPGGGWTSEKDDVGINGAAGGLGRFTTSDIRYDLNGNISRMDRVGHKATTPQGVSTYGLIDQLRYSYDGNRLQIVADQAGLSDAPNDFEDANSTGNDYGYDANGNLTSDANKGITIAYNELNLPSRIQKAGGKSITFTYSATGEKLSQATFNGTTTTQITYVGDFAYTQAAGPALSVATPTGRALYATTPSNSTRRWIQEYHIHDQLGNLRLAFRGEGQEPLQRLTATMESVNASEEEKTFDNLAATRQLDPEHARTGSYAARLNAGQSQRMYGPSTSVQVHSGDSVRFEIFGRYDVTKKAAALPLIIPAAAIGQETASSVPRENTKASTQSGLLPKLVAGITLAWTSIPHLFQHNAEVPRASIKYDFYDKDSTLIGSEIKYLEHDAANEWQKLEVGFKASQDGYVLASVQNASAQDVWFDDAALRTTTDELIVQENHFDPWGQNLVDIEMAGSPDCKIQYTGKERISDEGLEWTDYGARMYDAQLGRWHCPDPAEQYNSPYLGLGNNPVNGTDPDGRYFGLDDLVAAVAGGTFNLIGAALSGKITSIEKGLVYFGAGAAGGVVALYSGPGGFAVGGALNTAADAYYGEFKGMDTKNALLGGTMSFVSGGLSALGGGNIATAFAKAGAAQGAPQVENLVVNQFGTVSGVSAEEVAASGGSAAVKLPGYKFGEIVGWGGGKGLDGKSVEAVAKTLRVAHQLTQAEVSRMMAQGVTRQAVEGYLAQYNASIAAGMVAKNAQLLPRKALMEAILRLMPK